MKSLWGLLLFFVVVLWVILAVIEIALSDLGKIAARLLADEEKNPQTAFLLRLVEDREKTQIALYTGSQTCLVLLTYILATLFFSYQLSFHQSFLATFGSLLVLIIFFHQVIPRLIVRSKPHRLLLRIFPIVRTLFSILTPVANLVSSAIEKLSTPIAEVEAETPTPSEEVKEEEIQAFLDVGEEEGIIEEHDGALIQSVVEFGDKLVKECMTPRTEIIAIENTAPLKQVQELMIKEKHSRIPVYREHLDNIEGLVFVRDLLAELKKGRENEPVQSLTRPAHFVPETKRVADLLKELQHETNQMAIVIDEFGSVSGLVTVEDLVEEIVGEIHDEDEVRDDIIIPHEDGSYTLSGNLEIYKVEELFHADVSDQDYNTIAGFVVSRLGRVPSAGEKLEASGLAIEVLDSDTKRILRLRIRKKTPARAIS